MGHLGAEVSDTRLGLEEAIGKDWKHDDPSWAPSLMRQAYPVALRDALTADTAHDAVAAPLERRPIERDFGPDLGLGL